MMRHPTPTSTNLLLVPNTHLPEGHNLVPTAVWTGDGWLTTWSVRDPRGDIEPLTDYDHSIDEDDIMPPWPFVADYATAADFRAIGWEVIR